MNHLKIYEKFEEWDPFGEETLESSNILNMDKLYEEYTNIFMLKNYLEIILYEKKINIFDTIAQKMILEDVLVVGTLLKATKSGYKIAIRSNGGEITDLYGFDTIEILN